MLILLSSCISITGLETSFKSLMDKYPNIISVTRVWGMAMTIILALTESFIDGLRLT